MRLIDADELERKCLSDIQDNSANIWDIMNNIRRTKTVYNIDKVVEELNKRKGKYFDGITCEGTKIRINDAIEIVKRGCTDK